MQLINEGTLGDTEIVNILIMIVVTQMCKLVKIH